MRSHFLSLILACAIFSVQAKVLTVSNRIGTSADFSVIAEAVTAASAGDTLYIQGSEIFYDGFTLDKKLVIIGPGHKPNKQFALKASLGVVYLGGQDSDASGSTIMGLDMTGISSSYFPGSNITLRRCKIGSIYVYGGVGGPTLNWVIESNIITSISIDGSGNYPFNFIIHNNIFDGPIYGGIGLFITNNIFVSATGTYQGVLSGVSNSTFQNNIFFGSSPQGATNSTFNNNITYKTSANELPYGSNIGTANKVGIDPQFINVSPDGSSFQYEFDFHLKPSSPALGQGTDGQDIGVYSGTGFSETGEPPIPQVREFLIKNAVVAPGGKLSISVKAEAKN